MAELLKADHGTASQIRSKVTVAEIDVTLDVSLNIDWRQATWTREFLRKKKEAAVENNYYSDWHLNGRSEVDMLLSVAVLNTAADNLNCSTLGLIEWVESRDTGYVLEDYIVSRARELTDDQLAYILHDRDIETIHVQVSAIQLERAEQKKAA